MPSSSSSVAVRRSIRWVPGPATEPTDTVVLTGGKTGVFLDVRFVKGGGQLDWAFAGYRHQRLSVFRSVMVHTAHVFCDIMLCSI
jgi:hypothetical protein